MKDFMNDPFVQFFLFIIIPISLSAILVHFSSEDYESSKKSKVRIDRDKSTEITKSTNET